MTEAEMSILNLLGTAYSEFQTLPAEHPDDLKEFALAIHMAQNIVLAREGLRSMKRK